MKKKLDEVAKSTTKVKEKLDIDNDKGKDKKKVIDENDVILESNPPVQDEPFLRAIKASSRKALEGVPPFNGKMDTKLVMKWIKCIEDHFECEGIIEE